MPEKNPYAKFGTFTKPEDTLRHSFKQYNTPFKFFFPPIFSFQNYHWIAKAVSR